MWRNIAERDRPKKTIRRMRIARYTHTHSKYVMLIAFPQLQWLHEIASMLRYTHTAVLLHMIMCYKPNNVVQQIIFFHAVYHMRSSDHQNRKPEGTEVLHITCINGSCIVQIKTLEG